LRALGLEGKVPLFAAFLILCVYDYSSGLRAPALIAFVKDTMLYIVVIAAVAVIPLKLGGHGAVFDAAAAAFAAKGAGGILLSPDQYVPYATLALGSALALVLYPHSLTGIFASSSEETIRKNAMLLPAYSLLLGLVALLGYMGHAAGLKLTNANDVVPLLFKSLFPGWFAGFAFAAIGIGALVPAAVMSIGAANLFTRNFWKAYVNPAVSPAAEAHVARIAGLSVKAGALMVSLFLPAQFTLDLQLLGGVWILQTFPAIIFGLYSSWFRAGGILAGRAAGFSTGTGLVWANNFKPLQMLDFGAGGMTLYSGPSRFAPTFLLPRSSPLCLHDQPQKKLGGNVSRRKSPQESFASKGNREEFRAGFVALIGGG
jgi:solute:Na+ symporter, SSS family